MQHMKLNCKDDKANKSTLQIPHVSSSSSKVAPESAVPQCVHHKWPILYNRLPNWLTSNQQESETLLIVGGGCHMVTRAKHQGMLASALRAADPTAPTTHISKAIPPPGHLKPIKCPCDMSK